MKPPFRVKNLVGQRFGRWTVLRFSHLLCLSEIAELTGVPKATIFNRLARGLTLEECINIGRRANSVRELRRRVSY